MPPAFANNAGLNQSDHQRWLRLIPVALVMYTISYVDRTNVALALDPGISSMMKDLLMDDRLKGQAAGVFFLGYALLQVPGGFLASHWSPKKVIAISLALWGACAVGCGLAASFKQFFIMRILLGMAESAVYPATLVLLANWFPRQERARAMAFWCLCQPLAVAGAAPATGWLLGHWGWQTMLISEGALPFLWLPIWLYFINDHPRQARWLSTGNGSSSIPRCNVNAPKSSPRRRFRWGASCCTRPCCSCWRFVFSTTPPVTAATPS